MAADRAGSYSPTEVVLKAMSKALQHLWSGTTRAEASTEPALNGCSADPSRYASQPASQLGTVPRIAVCKVNGCTDPSLPWQAKPNRRSIHSIGIFSPRQELSPLVRRTLIIGSERWRWRRIMGTSILNPTKMAPLQGHIGPCVAGGVTKKVRVMPLFNWSLVLINKKSK